MPLLLLDLDNTLIDRAAAFGRWAEQFLARRGSSDVEADIAWLIDVDGDGFGPRQEFAAAVARRFTLDIAPDELLRTISSGVAENVDINTEVVTALDDAKGAGWTPVIVTNGYATQQERKIKCAGLERHVAGWVTSEAAGIAKPDRRIFELAAEEAGDSLDDAWMVGDNAEADIGGAHNAGLRSAWLHRGRTWMEAAYQPTIIADSCESAIKQIVASAL